MYSKADVKTIILLTISHFRVDRVGRFWFSYVRLNIGMVRQNDANVVFFM